MYNTREVAKVLGLSAQQVRAYVRAGFLAPERGRRGELRFSFQDLVILRTARELQAAQVPAARVRRALRKLKQQLPDGRPLTGVHIAAEGSRVVVRDGGASWHPESGQVLFDFGVADLARKAGAVRPIAAIDSRSGKSAPTEDDRREQAEALYERGCELEETRPNEAAEAYREAIALFADHADAHVNLGRLRHEAGRIVEAESHYRRALEIAPDDATAVFNLGVALEDQRRLEDAVEVYERSLVLDPGCADAHYNLARLYERLGRETAALRHLKAYKRLTGR